MVRPANPRTPYAVCVRYRWRDEPTTTHTLTYRKRLSAALETVRATTTAWLRLVGGQPQPLEWLVIDTRDMAEYRPGIAAKFGETDGQDETGRPYARRDSSAGVRGSAPQHARRGNRIGGGTHRA